VTNDANNGSKAVYLCHNEKRCLWRLNLCVCYGSHNPPVLGINSFSGFRGGNAGSNPVAGTPTMSARACKYRGWGGKSRKGGGVIRARQNYPTPRCVAWMVRVRDSTPTPRCCTIWAQFRRHEGGWARLQGGVIRRTQRVGGCALRHAGFRRLFPTGAMHLGTESEAARGAGAHNGRAQGVRPTSTSRHPILSTSQACRFDSGLSG
jgi:hypothetical protein